MTKLSLIEAIVTISHSLVEDETITGIEFEDGSGFKFNYHINGGRWKFIDLTNVEKNYLIDGFATYCKK